MSARSQTASGANNPGPDPPKLIKLEQILKAEHEEVLFGIVHETAELIKSESQQILYADHEIKEEMVIGPTMIHMQDPSQEQDNIALKTLNSSEYVLSESCLQERHQNNSLIETYIVPNTLIESLRKNCHEIEKKEQNLQHDKINSLGNNGGESLKSDLTKNLHIHDGIKIKPMLCDICYKTFSTKSSLTRHKDRHEMKSFLHDTSTKRFNNKSNLRQQLKKQHDFVKFSCYVCEKKITGENNFINHLAIHNDRMCLSCDKCDKTFINKHKLEFHIEYAHTDTNLACDICEKKFAYKRHLIQHTYKSVKELPCNICDKRFCNYKDLSSHLKVHGKKYSPRPRIKMDPNAPERCSFECNLCKKILNNKSSWEQHILTHSEVKGHFCDICKKEFLYMKDLLHHINQQHSVNPNQYACNICEEKFTHKSNLYQHLLQHSATDSPVPVPQFACNLCESRFFSQYYLKQHLKVH